MASGKVSELSIILLGKRLSLTSSVGNIILGRSEFETEDPPHSAVLCCESGRGHVEGKDISIINAPHLFNPHLSQEELSQGIQDCASLSGPGPHAFLIVVQPQDFTEKDSNLLKLILNSFSDQAIKYSIVITIDSAATVLPKEKKQDTKRKQMKFQSAKKNQSLTTAVEMRNQTQLVMQLYANWEEYLTPAPLSIAILGELVFISSSTDFSINKNPPKAGYKFIRYPDSFRACLMQVCNSGWGAFNEAHKNMDQIRLHTMAVPDYMKTAVKILFQDNDEVVQTHLPDQLENIRVIADDCLELANSTEKKFTDVINIIQELLEASVNAQCCYGEELEELDETKMELIEILISMRNCELKEIDFKTTVQMLVKGMDAMGRVKEQWEKMVCFFQMVSYIVKTSLTRTLKDFVYASEKTQALSYSEKLFSKDLLYNQAFQATNISNLVNMISATYTEVSTNHIMDRVSSLGKLMAMDKEKPEFNSERLQLRSSCDEAQRSILRLVLKNKNKFERKSLARLEKIDQELLAILLTAPELIKSIQAAVESGFIEEEIKMAQLYFPNVVLKNTAEAVIAPLKDGISSLNTVYEALIKADVDPVTGQCSTYDYIRQQIVQAHKNMEQSEHLASSGLKSLDENLERFTQDVGKLQREKRSAETEIENLRTEQTSNEELHRYSQEALEQARRNLNSTKQKLQNQESRKHTGGIVTAVGAGLFAIPVVGWIAGSAMIAGGAVKMTEAKRAIRDAEEEVGKSETDVKKYESKASEYESKISKIKHDTRQKDDKLKQMGEGIQMLKKQIEYMAEFQEKVRRATHLLGVLSGRVSVTERQTRRFVLQEPVMKVMEDVMKATEQIAENRLLYDSDVPKLIKQMKENSQRLAAICASENIPNNYTNYV